MVESTYKHYLSLAGEPTAAALLTLAAAIQQAPDKGLLRVREAAQALGVSTDAIYDLCDSQRLKHRRIGRSIRIDEKDLNDLKDDTASGGHRLRILSH
jgi:excisionase family DNA binding protein